MLFVPLALCLFSADPAPKADQLALLKTFREEFVVLAPGGEKHAAEFQFGGEAATSPGAVKAEAAKLTAPFAIAKYEVPQNLWEAVLGSNPSKWKGPRNSVEMLSLAEARDFCAKATALMRAAKLIDADQAIVLPTERQWEYAARAGTRTVYSFGDNAEKLGEFGWFTGNAAGNDPPVGAKKPNAWGLYDMHGYLWEWCETDPANPVPEGQGVLRSGSWKDKAPLLASAARQVIPAATRDDAVGLRCVLVPVKP